jgi:serine/threonine protein kinase
MERARGRVGSMVKDKWRLEALLGTGGTASVYSAVHRNGRRVAIKVLHPEMSAIPSVVQRFLREGYLANRVGHPNAVAVLDDDRTDDGAVFLVMELLEGYSLERHAKVGGQRLPQATILRLMGEALDVLAAAHAKGIVHRDIKPANLFLTTEGHVKVLDFGIARLAEPIGDAPLTHTGFSIGTPSFMPPEQARGRWEMVDARTDVWALGATMYALLTGDRPRHGETTQEELLLAMTQPLPPLASVAPHVPPEVASIVDRAVAHDRDARWPDAMAMRNALTPLLGEVPRTAPTHAPSQGPVLPPTDRPDVATLAIPDGALTTGRPFASQPLPSAPSGSRTAPGTVFGLAAVATLVVMGAAALVVVRRNHPAHAAAPAVATTTAAAMTATPTETATATAPPSAVVPDVPAPPAAPKASASATPSAHPFAKPPPAAPHGAGANPFDQRF